MKKWRWTRQGLAVLLSGAMLFSCLPASAMAEPTVTTAGPGEVLEKVEEPLHIVAELPELRGADEKHFRLSDGSMAAAKYPDAVHYETEAGWAEIDNSLSLEAAEQPVYSNRENAFKVSFAETADAEELVRLEQDGYSLSWTLAEERQVGPSLFAAGYGDRAAVRAQVMERAETTADALSHQATEKAQNEISGAADAEAESDETALPTDDPALQVENASSGIVYEDIRPGVDLQYILSGSQLKENLIIKKTMDTYQFTLRLGTDGLTAGMTDGRGDLLCIRGGRDGIFYPGACAV